MNIYETDICLDSYSALGAGAFLYPLIYEAGAGQISSGAVVRAFIAYPASMNSIEDFILEGEDPAIDGSTSVGTFTVCNMGSGQTETISLNGEAYKVSPIYATAKDPGTEERIQINTCKLT